LPDSYRWGAALLALLLIISGAALFAVPGDRAAESSVEETTAGEATTTSLAHFPKDQVIDVALTLSENDWADLQENALKEKDYLAQLTWQGVSLPNVALRAKGNSSLNSVAGMGSSRYSLKVDLDKYIKGQTLDGVRIINLNNGFSDPSYIREYLGYEAFASLGVPTPAMTWVRLTINGQLHGLYLAVEQIDQPFLARHYSDSSGDLYKPEGTGANLAWIDDSFSSYSGMSYKTNKKNPSEQDLIDMLDTLNNGGDLEECLDVDQVLRYLAASTVMSNFDSYQGSLCHNYYLYEQDGKFTILPWDLNMSFAGFSQGGSDDQMITVKLDEPTMGAVADRPLIAKLLAVEEYRQRYHEYVSQLVNGYLDPDTFAARAEEVTALISQYVKEDPTAFFTFAEFGQALETDLEQKMGGGGTRADQQDQAAAGQAADAAQNANANAAVAPNAAAKPNADGGKVMGLVSFVRQRAANVKQQLSGELPTSGDGSGMGLSSGRGGGQMPADGQAPPNGGQMPNGAQPPAGFDPTKLPANFNPTKMPAGGGVRPNAGQAPGAGQQPGAGQTSGSQASTAASGLLGTIAQRMGIQSDLLLPTAVSVVLLLAGILIVKGRRRAM
jgi:spore coat protein CotH